MARRKSPAVATIEHRAEAQVGSVIRRVTESMAAHSRSMLVGSQSTPFDALKPGSQMPVVGNLGPQSTGYYLPPLVRFSRHLDRNDGYVAKGLDIRADATVDTGPWPVFHHQKLNDLWEEWQLECDRRGKMTHGQIIKKAFRNQLSGGEGIVTLHDEPDSSDLVVPLTIKGIELDQVDSFDNRLNPDNGNRIISGVELDADDRVVAMWVLPYNPNDMNSMSRWLPSVRTPIADVCHLYEETEFSSVRGIPTIAPAIMKAIQEMKFENATAARMIASSLFTHWGEQTDKSAGGAKMPGEQDIDDWISDILVEPGAFNVLPFGVKVTNNTPPEAGSTYESYIKSAHRYKAAVLGVLYQEMTGDWENMTDRLHRAATLSITRRINADRQNIEAKVLRKQAKRFVDRCYLSGAWVPPAAAPQREWYRHDWRWPAARYQNLFQEMNAFKLATENSFMDDDTAVAELFGLDPRKVDRAQAVSKARKAALQSGPAADIIRAEVAKDELAVAEAFAKSDDDAVGLRKPMKGPARSKIRKAS